MEKVKVLVTHHLAREQDLAAIREMDPRVEAAYGLYGDRVYRSFMESRKAGGATDFHHLDPGDFNKEVAEAEVIFSLGLPKDILTIAPRLKWVQVLGAGMDYLEETGLLGKGVTITTSGGVNARAIAEFCILLMLQRIKQFPKRLQAQEEHKWLRFANDELRDRTLGIIGAGHIAQALAQRAKAFEMRVVATRRSYTPGEKLPYIDEVHPRDRMGEMLGHCDYVVVAVGLTPETRGMIGEAEFRAMKPGVFFINVGRGPVVDEKALLQALKSGHLGGAGLDVFEQEPLPSDSEFWGLPDVIVTPHNTGGMRDVSQRSTELFCANLQRYLNGEPLQSVVLPEKGY